MNKACVFVGWAVSFLLLASPGASADRNGTNACTAIRVTSPDAPAKTAQRSKKGPTFSAAAILDLKLEATMSPAVKGQHQVEFKVFTPKGHLYQSLTAATASPTSTQGGRQRTAKKTTASVMLPVAGTTIVTNSLYGQWKVEVFLDGEREGACAKPFSFVIAP
jgi:hypothetical protein